MRRILTLAVLLLPTIANGQAPALRFHSPAIVTVDASNKLEEAYGCRGKDLAPPIVFDAILQATTSLELTMIDNGGIGPYAAEGKGFVHWHVLGLPGAVTAYPRDGALPQSVSETANDFGKPGYGGPCPPHPPHLYTLTVIAMPGGARYSIDFTY
jgi:Raf kinase inhibitor-like YbhB/YbcL family protein